MKEKSCCNNSRINKMGVQIGWRSICLNQCIYDELAQSPKMKIFHTLSNYSTISMHSPQNKIRHKIKHTQKKRNKQAKCMSDLVLLPHKIYGRRVD